MNEPVTLENELIHPVDLCDSSGKLNPAARGWSRNPLHRCNLRGYSLRKKRWNYWCVTDDKHLFSVTVSNLDYMGLAFIYFLDFETKEFHEKTVMAPWGNGFHLPDTVYTPTRYEHSEMRIDLNDSGLSAQLTAEARNFDGLAFDAEFSIERPVGQETLNVVIPWSDDRFQFTSKQPCLPASGTVHLGDRTIHFNSGNSFACLDFGRGVWKYSSSWNWAAFSVRQGKDLLGLNLGGKWTDRTGYTENGILVNEKLTKISEDLIWEYDSQNFMRPWKVRTGRTAAVDLTFTPFYERIAKTDLLILRSEVHQMVGCFSGSLQDAVGKVYRVENAIGWAEEHQARW